MQKAVDPDCLVAGLALKLTFPKSMESQLSS